MELGRSTHSLAMKPIHEAVFFTPRPVAGVPKQVVEQAAPTSLPADSVALGTPSTPQKPYTVKETKKPKSWLGAQLAKGVDLVKNVAAAAYISGPILLPLALQFLGSGENAEMIPGSGLGHFALDKKPTSVLKELDEFSPRSLQTTLGRALRVAGKRLPDLGPSLDNMIELERRLQSDILAPKGQGSDRKAPDLLRMLAEAEPTRRFQQAPLDALLEKYRERENQLSPFPAFVYLGEDKKDIAAKIQKKFNHSPSLVLGTNPMKGNKYEQVWNQLVKSSESGKMPVYIDLDGSYGTPSVVEQLATRTVQSLVERSNTVGDDFVRPKNYYGWLVRRVDQQAQVTEPWLKKTDPGLVSRINGVKEGIAPLKPGPLARLKRKVLHRVGLESTKYPMFWKSDPVDVHIAHSELTSLQSDTEGTSIDKSARFADAVTMLDRDLSSGVQTQWIRLLRQLDPGQRSKLLGTLAHSFVTLNLTSRENTEWDKIAPPDAPSIKQHLRNPANRMDSGQLRDIPYDRARSLAQVVDHTIDGLGHEERRQFIGDIKKCVKAHKSEYDARDQKLHSALGTARPMPLDVLLNDEVGASPRFVRELSKLHNTVTRHYIGTDRTSRDDMLETARHCDMAALLAQLDSRFGEPMDGLSPEVIGILNAAPKPEKGFPGLGLGELYSDQTNNVDEPPKAVQSKPTKVLRLGEGPETKASVVLEGGGGKGFCYVECLEQTLKGLGESKKGSFAIDEFVGTSAGAITAGLLAGGFKVDELNKVMKKLDFREFFADYHWNQGGVDPKVRGLNRTGMFSTQKMYRTLHKLMADKLGIYNRPILFRDLPFKLKVLTTVMDTDLPQEHELRKQIGKDGQLVLGSDSTPNIDVIAALTASASIPAVFNAPNLMINNGTEHPYRLQLADGGVVNNFPVKSAGSPDETAALAVLPADYGELSTLDFDADENRMTPINATNRKRYETFLPPMVNTLNEAREKEGVERVVLAYNLSDTQERPLLQGNSRIASERLQALAKQSKMPVQSVEEGAATMAGEIPQGRANVLGRIAQTGVDVLLDDQNAIKEGEYIPPGREFRSLGDVIMGSVGAKMAAKYDDKRFENPSAIP
jgi:predicted acylesterase/phospholipase RssA